MSSERRRVKVRSDRKMVTLQGQLVRHDGEPVELFGVATTDPGNVQAVKFDDGRELLIAVSDLSEVAS